VSARTKSLNRAACAALFFFSAGAAAQLAAPETGSARVEREAAAYGMTIRAHETQGSNKWDPVFGVSAMDEMVKRGRLSIPYKTAADQEKAMELITQMVNFPVGVFDFCMTLWFCFIVGREVTNPIEGYYQDGWGGDYIDNDIYLSEEVVEEGQDVFFLQGGEGW